MHTAEEPVKPDLVDRALNVATIVIVLSLAAMVAALAVCVWSIVL